MKPVALMLAAEAIVCAGEATVKSTAVEPASVKSATAVEPTSVKSATAVEPASVKSATAVEPASVKSATAVKPSTAVEPSASAPMRVGEVWLDEYRSAQQRGCDAYQSPSHSWPGSVFA
jgi:hypothetical protein